MVCFYTLLSSEARLAWVGVAAYLFFLAVSIIVMKLKGYDKVVLTDWHRCSSWVVAAVTRELLPTELVLVVPAMNPAEPGEEAVIPVAKMGENPEASDMDYEVTEDADKVYLKYFSKKDPNNAHSLDIALVDQITVPELPAGKPVYLYGVATNPNILPIAYRYMQTAPAVWMMFNVEDGFTCAYSREGAQLGDYEEDTKFRFWAPENRPKHPDPNHF
mgnify:CR=1 FL=1